ncbi:EAL domain-containing protein [Vibrio sonorensis]|uniref:EAL domain-containing protein n=1 Tax=Vibrio sonorensis TaxID=1004316 RepID=UPI0008D9DCE8|nr:EAL domain-containing protein [Vibrio sonorensis]
MYELNVLGAIPKPVDRDTMNSVLHQYKPQYVKYYHNSEYVLSAEDVYKAIVDDYIQPYYQPKVNTHDKSVHSVEILARLIHPKHGVISPVSFIPIAEKHNLIDLLTDKILTVACRDLVEWRKSNYDFALSLNLSAKSLTEVVLPEKLESRVCGAGLKCEDVIIEITESHFMQNLTSALDILTRLCLKGFTISLDDFGTGYSSMEQIKNLPLSEIKIDRAFVHTQKDDPAALAILEFSASLAEKLGVSIVAEGVEEQQDWDRAVEHGCSLVQGYFIAKPMPANAFTSWLKDNAPL